MHQKQQCSGWAMTKTRSSGSVTELKYFVFHVVFGHLSCVDRETVVLLCVECDNWEGTNNARTGQEDKYKIAHGGQISWCTITHCGSDYTELLHSSYSSSSGDMDNYNGKVNLRLSATEQTWWLCTRWAGNRGVAASSSDSSGGDEFESYPKKWNRWEYTSGGDKPR